MAKESILIIKTGNTEVLDKGENKGIISLGDVLRTTPLLHKYKDNYITWATSKEAFPLLDKNSYIDNLLILEDWASRRELKEERFDKLINLEKVPGICIFADEDLKAWSRFGFRYDPITKKAKAHESAYEALAVSFNSKHKKENKRPFQELLFEMVGEKFNGEECILGYQPKSKEIYDLGFNTKVGSKWPSKSWPIENWDKLEKILKDDFSISRQDKQNKAMFDNLYSYIDWINSCKTLVTNDSLGLHIALTLKKDIIALFGPTSANELYLYNRGKSILPDNYQDCRPCFEPKCIINKDSCINLISPDRVAKEVKDYLK